jgi:hypothetical protein
MAIETPDSTKTPKQIRKKKRLDRRNTAAKKRAERLKIKNDPENKSSTYNTSTLDPNASVNYNAMNEAMFK